MDISHQNFLIVIHFDKIINRIMLLLLWCIVWILYECILSMGHGRLASICAVHVHFTDGLLRYSVFIISYKSF